MLRILRLSDRAGAVPGAASLQGGAREVRSGEGALAPFCRPPVVVSASTVIRFLRSVPNVAMSADGGEGGGELRATLLHVLRLAAEQDALSTNERGATDLANFAAASGGKVGAVKVEEEKEERETMESKEGDARPGSHSGDTLASERGARVTEAVVRECLGHLRLAVSLGFQRCAEVREEAEEASSGGEQNNTTEGGKGDGAKKAKKKKSKKTGDAEAVSEASASDETAAFCPARHALVYHTSRSGHSCDMCRARIAQGARVKRCHECDYDACLACSPPPPPPLGASSGTGTTSTPNALPPPSMLDLGRLPAGQAVENQLEGPDKLSCQVFKLASNGPRMVFAAPGEREVIFRVAGNSSWAVGVTQESQVLSLGNAARTSTDPEVDDKMLNTSFLEGAKIKQERGCGWVESRGDGETERKRHMVEKCTERQTERER